MIEGFFWGLLIGAVLATMILTRLIRSVLADDGVDLDKTVSKLAKVQEKIDHKISARVEEVNGVFYVYNAEDNSFLVQGSTLKELREHLGKRIPNANIVITEGEADTVARFKSILKIKSANGNETAT